MNFRLDVVLCLDITESMAVRLETIKQIIGSNFAEKLNLYAFRYAYRFSTIRLKLITFGSHTITKVSRWYEISNMKGLEQNYLRAYLNKINCENNSSQATLALEALALAITQDWTQEGDIRRHEIIMYTNNSACPLEQLTIDSQPFSPTSLNDLSDLWMRPENSQNYNALSSLALRQNSKYLILFAPQKYPWGELYETWDSCTYLQITNGEDVKFDELEFDFLSSLINPIICDI